MKQYNQTALKDICAVEQVGLIQTGQSRGRGG